MIAWKNLCRAAVETSNGLSSGSTRNRHTAGPTTAFCFYIFRVTSFPVRYVYAGCDESLLKQRRKKLHEVQHRYSHHAEESDIPTDASKSFEENHGKLQTQQKTHICGS